RGVGVVAGRVGHGPGQPQPKHGCGRRAHAPNCKRSRVAHCFFLLLKIDVLGQWAALDQTDPLPKIAVAARLNDAPPRPDRHPRINIFLRALSFETVATPFYTVGQEKIGCRFPPSLSMMSSSPATS